MKNKNVLITLWFADGLHGGVKYSAEIGEHFYSLGYNVYLCGVITNDAMKNYFAKHHIKLFNVAHFPTNVVFDLVWAHHWPIVPFLVYRGMKYKRIINSTISNILFIERPIWFSENIDMHLVLTNKTRDMFIHNYAIDDKKIIVLPNTAPDKYFDYHFIPKNDCKNIAVVSNHPPQEVLDALKILRKSNKCQTIVYGAGNSVDITPKVLAKYDVIITIGKTVQYALAMGIPVYNYDHFGGSGYITLQNIEKESQHNFSGRSFFIKKTAEQIAHEIITDYQTVIVQLPLMKKIAAKQYKLSKRVNDILNLLKRVPAAKCIQINDKNRLLFEYCVTFIDFSASHNGHHVPVIDCMSEQPVKKQQNKIRRFIRHLKNLSF